MSFSLCAMIWFSIKNNMIQREYLPVAIRYVLLNYFGGRSYLRALKKKALFNTNGQTRKKTKISSFCSTGTTQNTKSTEEQNLKISSKYLDSSSLG